MQTSEFQTSIVIVAFFPYCDCFITVPSPRRGIGCICLCVPRPRYDAWGCQPQLYIGLSSTDTLHRGHRWVCCIYFPLPRCWTDASRLLIMSTRDVVPQPNNSRSTMFPCLNVGHPFWTPRKYWHPFTVPTCLRKFRRIGPRAQGFAVHAHIFCSLSIHFPALTFV